MRDSQIKEVLIKLEDDYQHIATNDIKNVPLEREHRSYVSRNTFEWIAHKCTLDKEIVKQFFFE